jgi:hypothetical protein
MLAQYVRSYLAASARLDAGCVEARIELLFAFRIEGEAQATPGYRIEFEPPNRFTVISHPQAAFIDADTCNALLRVTNEEGQPLPRRELHVAEGRSLGFTDLWGRIEAPLLLRMDTRKVFRLRVSGFAERDVTLGCGAFEEIRLKSTKK